MDELQNLEVVVASVMAHCVWWDLQRREGTSFVLEEAVVPVAVGAHPCISNSMN